MRRRDERVEKAVGKYGYIQRDVADRLGMHFITVGRIIREGKRRLIK
jgi:hypothetical protein